MPHSLQGHNEPSRFPTRHVTTLGIGTVRSHEPDVPPNLTRASRAAFAPIMPCRRLSRGISSRRKNMVCDFPYRVLVIASERQTCYCLILDAPLTTADPHSHCPTRFIRRSAGPRRNEPLPSVQGSGGGDGCDGPVQSHGDVDRR